MQDELNEGLFGTSPLTQVSSPGSQDEEPQVSMIWPPVMEGSHEGPKVSSIIFPLLGCLPFCQIVCMRVQ